MRISPQTRSVIRQTAAELFGEEARVVLFGSRTDDDQRGGDIDLLLADPASPDLPIYRVARETGIAL